MTLRNLSILQLVAIGFTGVSLIVFWSTFEPIHAMPELHTSKATFFVETGNATHLSPRQACAVEAAARIRQPNPVLVYMKNVDYEKLKKENQWISEYKNLHIIPLDLHELFVGTPIEKLYESTVFQTGQYVVEHSADLARIALSKKFGGLYLDLDIILLRHLFDFGPFILRDLGNPVMHFESDTLLINQIFKDLGEVEYDPNKWVGVGGDVIAKSVKNVCELVPEKNNHAEAEKKCNILFMDPGLISPIFMYDWKDLAQKEVNFEKFWMERLGKAFSVNLSNHITRGFVISKNVSGLYNQIAKRYCPLAYESFPEQY